MSTPDMMREVIREVVREVIREVIAEEMAAVAASPASATKQAPTVATHERDGVVIARGALTERHVRSAGDAKAITIGHKVVITPLARERARTMGIEIIRVSVEG